jgi:hypothetical protein
MEALHGALHEALYEVLHEALYKALREAMYFLRSREPGAAQRGDGI